MFQVGDIVRWTKRDDPCCKVVDPQNWWTQPDLKLIVVGLLSSDLSLVVEYKELGFHADDGFGQHLELRMMNTHIEKVKA